MLGRLSSPQVLEGHQHFLFHFNGNKCFQEASFNEKAAVSQYSVSSWFGKIISILCFKCFRTLLLNPKVSGVSNAENAGRLDT